MKLRHSDSLIFVWHVADFEARQLKAPTIEPTHLLLGLCKTVDLDLPPLLPKDAPDRDEVLEELLREVRRLKNVFRAVGLNPKAFRRRLRLSADRKFALSDSARMRRSKAAKQVFAEAEHFASLGDSIVYPAHLLYAVLLSEDTVRDEVFTELGIDKSRFQEIVKREVVFRRDDSVRNSGAQWN
jgi:ATP-dependent Clp protease ATP-binding subunit ClpA